MRIVHIDKRHLCLRCSSVFEYVQYLYVQNFIVFFTNAFFKFPEILKYIVNISSTL